MSVPAGRLAECDATMIPVGYAAVDETALDFRSPRAIGATAFDTCFTQLTRDADGLARTTLRDEWGTVELWQDARMDYVMVYSGDGLDGGAHRRSLAVEPMTCAPNAFQSGDGLIWLQPGGMHICSWGIRAALES